MVPIPVADLCLLNGDQLTPLFKKKKIVFKHNFIYNLRQNADRTN